MCAIAGLLCPGAPDMARTAERMAAAQAHRGPDGAGVWCDAEAGIALAHRRLAVQDLSAAGAQPMASACGRFVISYNGEVFSAPEMRARLAAGGHVFRGHSDTEAVVEAIAAWGLEAALEAMVGQFAFALWDRQTRALTLVRDRIGIKPLYWATTAGGIAFASELKGVLAALPHQPPVSEPGLAAYLARGWVPAPLTIHAGVHKLLPGHLLRATAGAVPQTAPWWTLSAMLDGIGPQERVTNPAEGRVLIEDALGEAVRCRLLADVPLGAFLSGGVDSSLIAALMAEAGGEVRTFSIGSPVGAYDEAPAARRVAAHLGTRHTEMEVGEADCLAEIPRLGATYDEPFADSSSVPTLILSRLARGQVTVALSGDGGDEGFAGYTRHLALARIAGLPRAPLRAAARAAGAIPPGWLDRAGAAFGIAGAARRAAKLTAILAVDGPVAAQEAALTQWRGLGPSGAPPGPAHIPGWLDPVGRMQAADLATYLPDAVLTKVDRASMAHGLEVRVPFLDHRVLRAAFRLAPSLRIAGGRGKLVLRAMLADRLPPGLIGGRKRGFAIPIERWLRQDLHGWAAERLHGTDWPALGIDAAPVLAAWEAHRTARADHADRLWTLLMLADWAARR